MHTRGMGINKSIKTFGGFKVEKYINQLKRDYSAYQDEQNDIEESGDGIIDISLVCSLADSIPYLIKQIEELKIKLKKKISMIEKEIDYLEEKHEDRLSKIYIYHSNWDMKYLKGRLSAYKDILDELETK